MRKTDILLVVLFVVLILGIAFGPGLIEQWRTRDAGAGGADHVEPETVDVAESEERESVSPEQAEEAERVSGMLMLHQACVERFDDLGQDADDVTTAWEERYQDLLTQQPERDFRIVLAQPEGLEESARERARAEERALCEHNLEAMRAQLAENGKTAGD